MKTFVKFGQLLGLALAFATLFTSDVNGSWNSAQTWVVGDSLGPTGSRIIIDRNSITTGNGGPASGISTGGSGGEFRVKAAPGTGGTPTEFYTFCMQANENIFLGQTVRVASLTTQSIEPAISLAQSTSVLYREYLRTRTTGSVFGVAFSGQTVQNALWYFQGQTGGVNNALAQAVTSFMGSAAFTGLSNSQKAAQFGGVRIMNLVKDGAFSSTGNYAAGDRRQDMLVFSQSFSSVIPEPASVTMFLCGLAGFCGFLRRRKAV
jgi:hypothetical protein